MDSITILNEYQYSCAFCFDSDYSVTKLHRSGLCCFVCPFCEQQCTNEYNHDGDHMCVNGHQWN